MSNTNGWLQPLGLSTINKTLIKTALTHSSFKGSGYKGEDNERLEFLGDAVIGLICAELLYKGPKRTEGQMTNLRKKNVSNNNLATIFNTLKLKPYIRVAKNLNLSNKIKANFVEALFGAVYLSKGYQKCVKLWKKYQNLQKSKNQTKKKGITKPKAIKIPGILNSKSALISLCQKFMFSTPEYKVINKKGPDHNPVFTSRVSIHAQNNPNVFRKVFGLNKNQKLKISADGTSKKKKEAEMKAAHNLYKKIKTLE